MVSPSNLLGIAADITVSPFTSLFDFLLNNILAPLAIIVFIGLFFIGQYYLIKMYIFSIKTVFTNIVAIYERVLASKYAKEVKAIWNF